MGAGQSRESYELDSLLRAIARDISYDEAIEDLGKELGFSLPEIQNFIKANSRCPFITTYGTLSMLREWSQGMIPSKCRSVLKGALIKADLAWIAETHLQSASDSERNPENLTYDEVLQLKEELRRFYQCTYSNVRISPFYHESSTKLENIFTSLAMFAEGVAGAKECVDYDAFIKQLENNCDIGHLNNRIALFGEAGVGKTTFLAKLTLDWALGRCLEDIDFLFLIPLRENEGNTCLCDIIKSKISDDVELDGSKVEKYILKNQRKVLFLYDGLEEYGVDTSNNPSVGPTIAVIRGEKFKSSPVAVTARLWKANELQGEIEGENKFRFVKITGFKKENVKTYISKFFPDNREARDGLMRLMTDEDSLVADSIPLYPIYCSMLCYIWQKQDGGKIFQKQKLETFAQLFQELIHHLKDHYARKEENHGKRAKMMKKGENALQQFAKDAFSCLLKNKVVFEEEDIETSEQDLKTVCEIGVLAKGEQFDSRKEDKSRLTERAIEYRIPHKLLQEYLAGVHLASLYESNREEFNRLKRKLLEEHESFRYLLYFTVAQNKEVGKAVIGSLVDMLHESSTCTLDYRTEFAFLIDVAFECHEMDALEPMIPLLNEMLSLEIKGSDHTAHGWIFVYKACSCFLESIRLCLWESSKANGISAAASNAYARSICAMSKLQTLELRNDALADDFFLTLAAGEGARPSTTPDGSNGDEAENENGFVESPITHLDVGLQSLPLLWQLNVASLCPNVKKVSVYVAHDDYSFHLNEAWPLYSHDVELHLYGCACFRLFEVLFAARTVTRLSVTDMMLTNDGAVTLITRADSYPHLKNVSLIRCDTTEDLDQFCEKINAEGKLHVTVEHGERSMY
ncbi:NLR family CARD domain-containing protein 4-like [Diadema setosum]|uniref:NLR family CARD domain-containing protein 4-like n=1 Tax=Diadema setosum TaxID=31175 RepID=UPI003B3A97A0